MNRIYTDGNYKFDEHEYEDIVVPPELQTVIDTISTTDEISAPSHYLFTTPAHDVLDVLRECGFDLADHYVASAIAYLCRCKKKNQYGKDLKKAAFFINKAIELHDKKSNEKEAERSRG